MGGWRNTLVAWGPLGLLIVAFIESAGVPSPSGTDALILVVSMARPGIWFFSALLAFIGSIAGSLVFYEIVSRASNKFLRKYTSSKRGAKLRAWFDRYGLATVFVCALVPLPFMPLKVMAVCACALRVNRWRFIGTIALARIPRYGGMAYLGSRLGENATDWLSTHLWQMGVFAVVLLVGLYLLLRFADRGTPQIAPAPTDS